MKAYENIEHKSIGILEATTCRSYTVTFREDSWWSTGAIFSRMFLQVRSYGYYMSVCNGIYLRTYYVYMYIYTYACLLYFYICMKWTNLNPPNQIN